MRRYESLPPCMVPLVAIQGNPSNLILGPKIYQGFPNSQHSESWTPYVKKYSDNPL